MKKKSLRILILLCCLSLLLVPTFASANYCDNNQPFTFGNSFNHLVINNNGPKATLDWGDGSSCMVERGNTVTHDYAYNVNGWKSYNVKLGGNAAGTITIYDNSKSSVFVLANNHITNPPINICQPPQTTVSSFCFQNEWNNGNYVIIPTGTVIYDTLKTNQKVLNLVQNSFWLVKITSGPSYFNGHTWYKIRLANNQEGWIIQTSNPSPF